MFEVVCLRTDAPGSAASPQYVLIGAPTIPLRLRAVPYLAARERESRCLALESFRYRVGRPTCIQRMKTEEATDLMASLANALKEEISTHARREVRRQTAPADKAMARCTRDIAALKREVQALEHKLASLGPPQPGLAVPPKKTSDRAPPSRRAASKVSATSTAAKPSPRSQFSGEALKAHRERLGLSADSNSAEGLSRARITRLDTSFKVEISGSALDDMATISRSS